MTKWKYFTVTGGAALILSGTVAAWAGDRNSSMVGSLDDVGIKADVMEAIAQHRDLGPPNQIYVDTRNHVVYLSGVVITSQIEGSAEDAARQVPGVTRVVNTIGVDE
jgi:osmotically-inducible protein OsmY